MKVLVLALVLALVVFAWLLTRRHRARNGVARAPATGTESARTAFHAVSIRFESNACKAARDLEGRRFLSNRAPRLPLPECDARSCGCRFIHHKDRRSGRDRRSPFGTGRFGGISGRFDEEQRRGTDRRSDDTEDLF